VFERFFRASSALDLHIQGVGLGLMIVKTIVEGHGGTMSLSSKPGAGTTFRLVLPLRQPSDSKSATTNPHSTREVV
jgi:signal transduction histidine kinase